jgi:hypothetical protein
MPTRPAFSPDWREGRFFDRWMLVHLISGVAGGFGNVFFGLSTPRALMLAFAIMLLWEVGELLLGVREAWTNRVLDIGVGMVGAALALLAADRLTPLGHRIAFWLTLAVALTGSVAGWLAFRRRTAN